MIKLEIKSSVNVRMEEVLEAVSNLDTPELEDFFQRIAEIVVRRKSDSSSSKESALLAKINTTALAEATQEEYKTLYQKLQVETINKREYERPAGLLRLVLSIPLN